MELIRDYLFFGLLFLDLIEKILQSFSFFGLMGHGTKKATWREYNCRKNKEYLVSSETFFIKYNPVFMVTALRAFFAV